MKLILTTYLLIILSFAGFSNDRDKSRNEISLSVEIKNFYGINTSFNYDFSNRVELSGNPSYNSISEFWKNQNMMNNSGIINYITELINTHNLHDWGVYLITNKISSSIYPDKENEKNLFTWYILNQLGYNSNLGYTESGTGVLIASDAKIRGVPYYQKNGSGRMYSINTEGTPLQGNIQIFRGEEKSSKKIFSFNLNKIPLLTDQIEEKEIEFSHNKVNYRIKVRYSLNQIDMLKNYPMVDLPYYFEWAGSNEFNKSIEEALLPILKGKTELEAAGILLSFTQAATKYMTDDEQFGKERILLPEESFFFGKSDCEDRSILFSYLVNKFLGLKVVGVNYKDHLATAVKFTENVKGTSYKFEGEDYVICDPTYIGARIGMVMKEYKDSTPELFRTN
jgi:hypothetical protein